MRIAVAGANGFLGSRVVRACHAAGHQVLALVRRGSDCSRLNGISTGLVVRHHDQTDLKRLLVKESPLDGLVNAAVIYGRENETVSEVVEANLLFPLRLLEAGIAAECRCMLTFGTYFERSRLYGVLQPYVLTKRHFPDYARSLAKNEGVRLINLRLEHLYGPGDRGDKFVSRLIDDCLAGARVPLTAGEQSRDFLHVDDAAAACLCILEKQGRFRPGWTSLELGSGTATNIRQFAELVQAACGHLAQLDFGAIPYRAGEIMRSVARIDRLRRLGWEPQVPLVQGIEELVAERREPVHG